MKIVSKIIFVILITLISCNKKKSLRDKDNVLNSASSYVNYDADSVFYKISVGYENNNYYKDKKENLLFLITREVYVDDKNLGGFSQFNWYNSAKKLSTKGKNAFLVTKIGIKKIDKTYDFIWKFDSEISFNNESYGVHELNISLDDSYATYNNKLESRLHITFKTVGEDNGYKLYTLSYTYTNKQWQLVSRERICTIKNDINHEKMGYCVDTINSNCQTSGNKFNLTYGNVFNLDSEVCN
jgi:hypothetical protein